ncbi:1-acyl-sn-glycerol-3-phosphate acyltransferase [uncultured Duncaniella sp.]|uniref:1-acyl-sn-glycerol-3-phosphate acyltransferase n=1 Tax=uncultured Duncaniella sp. TaxID=2768039 RepID=UPI0025FEBFAA|nr:1-acyl-sn-glycerol-3-phosphate acyltransferase [uncultured Duncaniella sp.]
MKNDKTPMRIDIDEVLRQRMSGYYKFIPKFAVKLLERVICQDGLNRLLLHNADKSGVDFCRGVIDDLGVSYRVNGSLPKNDSRVIIVSNHPLGGLDGMILAAMVSEQYGGRKDVKFVVNDLLTFVEPLRPIFLGVNKHGKQSREAAAMLEEAFESDVPMLMFPAGLVSRQNSDGLIADLKWNKMVVNKAISSHRDIIPLHFGGENSRFFYKFARLRTLLGLKFNIEMVRLPAEVFKSAGKTFDVNIGAPIRWQSLRGGKYAQSQADCLREAVYSLAPR